ncbi:unnamed protein product [Linum trigynum]|uniref:Uncharacterized protein n=1 Tax=Linum trigynum TaxID=586398 RepID=A0AAV2DV29_9ROSI
MAQMTRPSGLESICVMWPRVAGEGSLQPPPFVRPNFQPFLVGGSTGDRLATSFFSVSESPFFSGPSSLGLDTTFDSCSGDSNFVTSFPDSAAGVFSSVVTPTGAGRDIRATCISGESSRSAISISASYSASGSLTGTSRSANYHRN